MKNDSKSKIIQRITDIGVIPVVRAESKEVARRAIAAIRRGGIPIIEVTMTVPDAIGMIEELSEEFGAETIIGAGTVLDAHTARKCVRAGALFIVSPTMNVGLIAFCNDQGVVVMPGALTPTEVASAWSAGADFVKVFPAGAVGGATYIRSLKAPLPQIKLVPTGGVSLKTARAFIEAGADALGVGNELVDINALRLGQDARITERAQHFMQLVKRSRKAMLALSSPQSSNRRKLLFGQASTEWSLKLSKGEKGR